MSEAPVSRPFAGDVAVPPAPILTLADVRPGDTVEMGAVPDGVREALAGLGVREGSRVRCESARQYVVVRTDDGCVPLDRGLAAAVPVTRVDERGAPAD